MQPFDENAFWEEQWALHAPGFEKGVLRVSLPNRGTFFLKPGPGFGDLSHPTTRMVLQLLVERVEGKRVVDIGSGSGILSMAAYFSLAKEVIALDIDPKALEHGKKNSALNHIPEEAIQWLLPTCYRNHWREGVILMNMISSEQEVAWASVPSLHSMKGTLILSGLLASQTEEVVSRWKQRGWSLKETLQEEEWVALLFTERLDKS